MMKAEIEKVEVLDLGIMNYDKCLNKMYEIRDQRKIGVGRDILILVEHPPVATLGRRGEMDEIIDDELPVYKIERGGKSTYHAPGGENGSCEFVVSWYAFGCSSGIFVIGWDS